MELSIILHFKKVDFVFQLLIDPILAEITHAVLISEIHFSIRSQKEKNIWRIFKNVCPVL